MKRMRAADLWFFVGVIVSGIAYYYKTRDERLSVSEAQEAGQQREELASQREDAAVARANRQENIALKAETVAQEREKAAEEREIAAKARFAQAQDAIANAHSLEEALEEARRIRDEKKPVSSSGGPSNLSPADREAILRANIEISEAENNAQKHKIELRLQENAAERQAKGLEAEYSPKFLAALRRTRTLIDAMTKPNGGTVPLVRVDENGLSDLVITSYQSQASRTSGAVWPYQSFQFTESCKWWLTVYPGRVNSPADMLSAENKSLNQYDKDQKPVVTHPGADISEYWNSDSMGKLVLLYEPSIDSYVWYEMRLRSDERSVPKTQEDAESRSRDLIIKFLTELKSRIYWSGPNPRPES